MGARGGVRENENEWSYSMENNLQRMLIVFFLIFMRIHGLFTRTFNLDSRIWHLSEKVS